MRWLAVLALAPSLLAAQMTISGTMSISGVVSFGHAGGASENSQYVNSASNQTNEGATTAPITYTCASTANRLIAVIDTSGTTISLTDTGGQASGATSLASGTWSGTVEQYKAWNMGCAAGTNTVTANASGGGGTQGIVFSLVEYAGPGTGGDGVGVANGTGTSCAVSATAADAGDLAFVYLAFGSQVSSVNSTSLNLRQQVNVGGTITYGGAYGFDLDNIFASIGSNAYTIAFPASETYRCLELLVPASEVVGSPYQPFLLQAIGGASGSPFHIATPFSVTSGDVVSVAVSWESSTAPTTVTGVRVPTYTLQKSEAYSTSNGVFIYTGVATSSGVETVTATGTGDTDMQFCVGELSGPAGTITNTAGATGGTPLTWSQAVSNNDSIVFAAVSSASGSAFAVGPSPATLVAATSGFDLGLVCQWTVVLASGTSSPDISTGSAGAGMQARVS